jgi:hypothetical protein
LLDYDTEPVMAFSGSARVRLSHPLFSGWVFRQRSAPQSEQVTIRKNLPKEAWAKKVRGFLPFAGLNSTEPSAFRPEYAKWLQEIKLNP